MRYFKKQKNTGFTLVEVIVSVMILSTALAAILTISASSIFAIRYSKNRIIANQLLQESLEVVRNVRDTAKQQAVPVTLPTLATTANVSGGFLSCFTANGCYTDLFTGSTIQVLACGSTCPQLYFSNTSTTTPSVYDASIGKNSNWSATDQQYIRKITMSSVDAYNTVMVTATITWLDKGVSKSISQNMVLTNWSL